MKQNTKVKSNDRLWTLLKVILVICSAAAVSIMLYPEFADCINDHMQITSIGKYEDNTRNLDADVIDQIRQEADLYNARIYDGQKHEPFIYLGPEAETEEYYSILNTSDMSGIMAYIEIPSIKLEIPVVHGTGTDKLKFQAGHMFGTSVPTGGINTHSVITAHTGLDTAKLFTDIVKLKEGDEVYVHILGETHVYSVCEINVTEPLEFTDLIQIQEGRDLITLFTCTPFGINSHRLLVMCERTGDIDTSGSEGVSADINAKDKTALIKAAALCAVPLVIISGGMILIFTKRRKKKAGKTVLMILVLSGLIPLAAAGTGIRANADMISDTEADGDRKCSISIDYKEGADGSIPVEGAVFSAYKVAAYSDAEGVVPISGIDINIEADDAEQICKKAVEYYKAKKDTEAVYTCMTDASGNAVISGMEHGIYLIAETEAAPVHVSSSPFIVQLPYTEHGIWQYDAKCEPKAVSSGSLKITKTVKSSLNDKDIYFNFKVTFESFDENVPFERSDGSTGMIKSGGTVKLKDGQSVILNGIPEGTKYHVEELEADKGPYKTASTGSDGMIRAADITAAGFVNSQGPPDTGDTYTAYVCAATAVCAVILAFTAALRKKRR